MHDGDTAPAKQRARGAATRPANSYRRQLRIRGLSLSCPTSTAPRFDGDRRSLAGPAARQPSSPLRIAHPSCAPLRYDRIGALLVRHSPPPGAGTTPHRAHLSRTHMSMSLAATDFFKVPKSPGRRDASTPFSACNGKKIRAHIGPGQARACRSAAVVSQHFVSTG
jgi:hypothetical protein